MNKNYSISSGKLVGFVATGAKVQIYQASYVPEVTYDLSGTSATFRFFDVQNYINLTPDFSDFTAKVCGPSNANQLKFLFSIYELSDGGIEVKIWTRNPEGSPVFYSKKLFGTGNRRSLLPLLYDLVTVDIGSVAPQVQYKLVTLGDTTFYLTRSGAGQAWYIQTSRVDGFTLINDYDYVVGDIIYTNSDNAGDADEVAQTALIRANQAIEAAGEANTKASRLEKIDVNGLISI